MTLPLGGLMPTSVGLGLALCTALAAHGRRSTAASSSPAVIAPPARFLRFPSFLGTRRAAEILHSTALRTRELTPSTVTGNVADYRRSNLLWRGDTIAPDVIARVRALAPGMMRLLRVAPFTPGEIESQVTVSSDGDFFKKHDDCGSPETAGRKLSWVYYVHREPCPFVGGELVMYGAKGDGRGDGAFIIEPENDSLIVFPSDCLHEVRHVSTPTRSPYDARVTVNGWVRA